MHMNNHFFSSIIGIVPAQYKPSHYRAEPGRIIIESYDCGKLVWYRGFDATAQGYDSAMAFLSDERKRGLDAWAIIQDVSANRHMPDGCDFSMWRRTGCQGDVRCIAMAGFNGK